MTSRTRRWLAPALAAALSAALAPSLALAAKPASAAITFAPPSPAEDATLSTDSVSFAFDYPKSPKQTKSVTCTLAGPTASSGPCAAPTPTVDGATSGASYDALANGAYTFTATVRAAGATMTATRQFSVNVATCTSDIEATVPTQDGATHIAGYAPDAWISRARDVEIDGALTGDCPDASLWTFVWTYRQGDAAPVPVPSTWIGATGPALTIPKWTLDFYDATELDYTFTVTATPPSASTQSPLSADLVLRVYSMDRPVAGFSPTGFTQAIVPGQYTFDALRFTPNSSSPDWPADEQDHMGFTWTAEVFGGDEITPDSGQGTSVVRYTFGPVEYYRLVLTVCPVAPQVFNGCTSTSDFVFATTAE
ncbi:MAG TPA: hypothetical protein VFI15_11040 [Candidatus Limnocylindrales bacterium]|nr:hypothetical protein [Candidatus Limnocylindrales bacterium]